MKSWSISTVVSASVVLAGCLGEVKSARQTNEGSQYRELQGGGDSNTSSELGGGPEQSISFDAGESNGGAGYQSSGTSGEAGSNSATTSGGSQTGGSSNSGNGAAGELLDSGAGEQPPTPTLGACNDLAATGVFEEITPPEVKAGIGVVRDGGGTFAIAVDPVNQGTLYAGTMFSKVWKSVDCGATWTHISTGRNGSLVDSGMNWTFAIDPQEPKVVYTNSGYGSNALYKSSNGGVDWDVVWPPPSQPELADAFQYNFANVVAIDPYNHSHLLLTFHESCRPPHTATCIAESLDAGVSWRLLDGEPGWDGNEGQVVFFLNDSNTWLWGSQNNGFWRSGDRGQSWQAIHGMTTSHLQGSQLVRTRDGTFYVAGSDGIWRSHDGAASTWTLMQDTGPIAGGLVANGTNMFASTCYFPGFCNPRYLRSPEADGRQWTPLENSPNLSQGGTMAYDEGHKLLYSSNLQGGLWRVVLE